MKTIQTTKRLYTVIPRPGTSVSSSVVSLSHPPSHTSSLSRSRPNTTHPERRTLYTHVGSAPLPLHYFDPGPTPPPLHSSRTGNSQAIVTTRVPQSGESPTQSYTAQGSNSSHQSVHPHQQQAPCLGPSVSLASNLTPSTSEPVDRPGSTSTSPLFVYPWLPGPSQWAEGLTHDQQESRHQAKRYQLDVGASGIPKRGRKKVTDLEGLDLATLVGEDAYFVRDDAMGVADGVGGWNRMSPAGASGKALPSHHQSNQPSPSALFARRLMHFCSFEIGRAASCTCTPPSSSPSSPVGPQRPVDPHPRHTISSALLGKENASFYLPSQARDENVKPNTVDNMERFPPLDQLSDHRNHDPHSPNKIAGTIDPVDILEKAYRSAVAAHCAPSPARLQDYPNMSLYAAQGQDPLLQGSSTALLAILSDETLRIAHLGDCTGLLIRDGEVVWRSEEMWWAFNCPLQLGPTSSTKPADARTYEVDVKEDDILILASDGMSDNLWEEDILDEVGRFSNAYLAARDSPGRLSYGGLLGRRAIAGMLSQALCSRAKAVSESGCSLRRLQYCRVPDNEVPFARRAREEGKCFEGGKSDDISVLVAVISPIEKTQLASSMII